MILVGDCRETLRLLPSRSIDAVVTDPPYGLSKEPDAAEVLRHWLAGDDYTHTGGGFMGKSWDSFVPGPTVWREVFRVLKPGGHVLCFAGTRTQDLMGMALRLVGFEIRDTIAWAYGTGFPKSHDVSKAAGAEQWQGWGTALKPAYEPVIVARKPLAGTVATNVLEHGTGAINIDGCRVGSDGGTKRSHQADYNENGWRQGHAVIATGKGRHPANLMHDGSLQFPGGAERFFYCAKASAADRDDGLEGVDARKNTHPTVKPTDLMRYLCRLVTPPGGTVLDPFTGSGSTGRGAALEGFKFIGVELSPEYADIARARIAAVQH